MQVYSSANIIAILNEACGEAASRRLVDIYGGQRIDIPKTIVGRLLETLGRDIAAVLVDQFGGCRIETCLRKGIAPVSRSPWHSGMTS